MGFMSEQYFTSFFKTINQLKHIASHRTIRMTASTLDGLHNEATMYDCVGGAQWFRDLEETFVRFLKRRSMLRDVNIGRRLLQKSPNFSISFEQRAAMWDFMHFIITHFGGFG